MNVLFLAFGVAAAVFSQTPDDVFIVRDGYGTPHIFGKTDPATAYGLAWAHAEDDFPSIFKNLCISRGRLGEVTGVEGAKFDFFARWTRARELVERRYALDLSPETRALIEGYIKGLNAYAAAHPREVTLKNFFPVTAQDLLTTYVVSFCAMNGGATALAQTLEGKSFKNQIVYGSNGFALNSRKTADGSTYLVNDPHWLIDGTLTFYEARLHSETGWNVLAGLYPGMPVPANAVNEHLGWNLPFNFPDMVDVYRLQTDKMQRQYRFGNEWKDIDKQKIKLKAKTKIGVLTVNREIWHTVHGPAIKTKNGVFAFRMNSLFNIKAAEQMYRMSKARNFHEFENAVRINGMPLFSIVYADRYDTIYYRFNALVPHRTPGTAYDDVLPGHVPELVWTEFKDNATLPHVVNPPSGFVYNTNNSPFRCTAPEDNPRLEDYDPQDGYQYCLSNDRDHRFMELINEKEKIGYADLLRIVYDVEYPQNGPLRRNFEPFLNYDACRKPALWPAVAQLRKTVFSGSPDNRNIALLLYAFMKVYRERKPSPGSLLSGTFEVTENEVQKGVAHAQKSLLKHFGRLDPKLGEVQRLVRGKKSVPCPGLPQALHSTDAEPAKNGVLRVNRASSYLQIARFAPDGPVIETCMPYGNSNRPDSPHFDDQMEIYRDGKRKTMTLKHDFPLDQAVRVYRPGR